MFPSSIYVKCVKHVKYVSEEAMDFSAICNAEKTIFTSIFVYEFKTLEQNKTKQNNKKHT